MDDSKSPDEWKKAYAELRKRNLELEERNYELERMSEFIELHTGKRNVAMQLTAMGEKIVDGFKYRGTTFGRALLAPSGTKVQDLLQDALRTRRNYLPLFALVFGKDWTRFQQVNKWDGVDPYQVAAGKSMLLTTLLAFVHKEQEKNPISTLDQLLGLVRSKWHERRIQEMNKLKYYDYRNKCEVCVTLYNLGEIEERIRDYVIE